MAIQDDNTILNKGDLKAYHEAIAPLLGGTFMVRTNNSDFYSTDEKVVGVWTDGKPVYQKVFTGTTPTVTSTYADEYTSLGISIDEVVDSRLIMRFASGSRQVIDCSGAQSFTSYSTSSTIDTGIKYTIQNNSNPSPNTIYISVKAGNYSAIPYVLILQYTKTTDTAGSATTTPGAYDINFPNTWSENTEIYFGNGVYGYRLVGNMPAISPNQTQGITFAKTPALTQNTSIISFGGMVKIHNSSGAPVGRVVNGTTQGTSTSAICHFDLLRGADTCIHISTLMYADYSTTSDTYDVWVTYTK